MQQPDAFSTRFGRYAGTDEGRAILADLSADQRTIVKRRGLIHDGQMTPVAFILHEGWLCSYKQLPDGGRQVIDLHLPGDLVGLRNLFSRTADRDVEALTDSAVSEVTRFELVSAMRKWPLLAEAVMLSFARDEAIVAQHLANIGRRNAVMRTAHLLLELGARLHGTGKGTAVRYDCPLSQQTLADTLGLTNIHLNRVLRNLRVSGLLTFSGGVVEILNLPALTQMTGFDPSYLELAL